MAVKEELKNPRMYVALFIVAGFILLALMYVVFPNAFAGAGEKALLMITGVFVSALTTIVQYYFGSSQGSQDKTRIIERGINGEKRPLNLGDVSIQRK